MARRPDLEKFAEQHTIKVGKGGFGNRGAEQGELHR